ncbi:variant erythrocyte surface antigen-1 family protein [Babesia caballi]|uniref:Variant erythrocyte surface antigen-1 family protein n=1 Tax=Babesia caballi TaxID=5871 RepID=A0AAV4LRW8_BABCB|nr:variant erythrocyte surface antigen-1 family protein [Babesia caballi]
MAAKSLTDCPSNVKEAIDWILRVTGKDGGGSDHTPALANAVKGQLEDAGKEVNGMITKNHENGDELHKLKAGLQKAKDLVEQDLDDDAMFEYSGTPGPIGMLSSALARFIGYGAGRITGAGIAPSNIATHRLCDATIAFTIGVLEGCRGKTDSQYRGKIDGVMKTLHGKYGAGTEGLQGVVTEVRSQLMGLNGNVKSFLEDIGTAFEKLNSLSNDASTVAEKVGEYLKGVFKGSNGSRQWKGDADQAAQKLQALVKKSNSDHIYNTSAGDFSGNIGQVNSALNTTSAISAVKSILTAGKNAFIWQLQKRNYESYYKGGSNNNIKASTHAKIFLGCLPLIFNNLSYFYWQCREGGPWQNHNLTGGPLSPFMEGHWFRNSYMNENMTGTSVVKNVMKTSFKEFSDATSNMKSYSDFIKNFRSKGEQAWKGNSASSETNYLSGLYILTSCYFQCQQIKVAERASRSPKTIREMLYFLAALQFSPQYDAFDGYVTSHFQNITSSKSPDDSALQLDVADSASDQKDNKLSAAALKEYIHSTCSFCPSVLGWLQGARKADDPWLHRLFSNTEFSFRYPSSGTALFHALSDYTYALQFQLSFLYKQCEYSYDNGCGWFYCRYGSAILPKGSDDAVTSHLCEGFKCQAISKCEHNSNPCKHDEGGVGQNCGQDGSNSPVQAFLTDCLGGFCLKHPGTSSHLAVCSGSTCHVPMGFKSDQLRTENKLGGHIVISLKPFCGSSTTPLRQLCGTLACLSKRAPKSLGDLFGFYWQVTGQLFNKLKTQDGKPTLDNTITTLLSKLTTVKSGLLYNSITANVESIGRQFFGLSWHCHKKSGWQTVQRTGGGYCNDHQGSSKACDLMSLYDSECTGKNCGKYLEPLGISSGATFANDFAFHYLSWAAYLTDDLYESLQEFLESFNGHNCKVCNNGCSHPSGGHGSSDGCNCRSVVECSDVLPHLYTNGFGFHNAHWLRGRDYTSNQWKDNSNKRTCAQFHDQLQSVISGNPLKDLLESIDQFLYLFRFYFLSNLSSFWTIYMCLILYTFFFLLDTLHLRSHLKFTLSHTVPPLALLTSGNPLPTTKLTYLTQ